MMEQFGQLDTVPHKPGTLVKVKGRFGEKQVKILYHHYRGLRLYYRVHEGGDWRHDSIQEVISTT